MFWWLQSKNGLDREKQSVAQRLEGAPMVGLCGSSALLPSSTEPMVVLSIASRFQLSGYSIKMLNILRIEKGQKIHGVDDWAGLQKLLLFFLKKSCHSPKYQADTQTSVKRTNITSKGKRGALVPSQKMRLDG
jgi:hypothetical protein